MSVESFVLVCALNLLGRSADRLPPLLIVDRPADASPGAVAFVRRGEPAIYIVGTSALFRDAVHENRNRQVCRNLDLLRLLASTIVHEEWHLRHGADERGAYYAQLTEMQRLGSGPGRWPYETVRRAMKATLERDAERLRVSRQRAAGAPALPPVPSAAITSERPWLGTALESLPHPVAR